jgi:hypothetical protein
MKPNETYRDKTENLKGNIQNMRANHFDIGKYFSLFDLVKCVGMARKDPMLALSATQFQKAANSVHADKIGDFSMSAHKETSGKEHWCHGVTYKPRYASINQVGYTAPNATHVKREVAAETKILKDRIGNHNFKVGT